MAPTTLPTLMNASKKLMDRFIREAVQAQIDLWEAQRNFEVLLHSEFENLGDIIESLAVSHDSGQGVSSEAIEVALEELK